MQEVKKSEGAKRGLVGMKYNHDHVLAFSYEDGLDVRVTADRFDEGWMLQAVVDNKAVFSGYISAGGGYARAICRFVRNGIVSRRLRHRRSAANKAKREGAGETPALPGNGEGAAEGAAE